MKLIEQLATIQAKLKAPKGQFNDFGKYAYRNCEDILQAVKPLLKGSVILLRDEIILVGDRVYIKATAKLTNGEESIGVHACAREPLEKKGMDASQITGAASSYARKYALNGLLLIDDNKDADVTNEYAEEAEQYHDMIEAGNAFEVFMFTQVMEIEQRAGLWSAYKAEYIGKGAIGATKAKIHALSESGRTEALRALEAFSSDDATEAEEALAEYTPEQIEFINTIK